jgi:hypothetical protein
MGYTVQQQTWTVLSYAKHQSFVKVQREYQKKFGKNTKPPRNVTIKDWWKKFNSKGNVGRKARINTKFVLFLLFMHHLTFQVGENGSERS